MKSLVTLGMVAAGSFLTSAGAAQIENGGFEQPNLAGWTVHISDTWADDSVPRPLAYVAPTTNVPPLQGHQSALIVATSNWNVHNPYVGITCAEDMFNPRFCPYPPPGMSSSLPTGGPALSHPLLQPSYYVGSIGQDFDARAGDQLVWEWQPFGPLWQGGGHPFAQITNGNYVLSLLSYGGSWFYEERTGGHWNFIGGGDIDDGLLWGSKSFAIPIDGRWTVYFGAVQHSD